MKKRYNIAVLASGNGTNAENLVRYFENSPEARVSLILTNNKRAGVLARADKLKTGSVVFDREDLYGTGMLRNLLKDQADILVLAGFLWKIPEDIIADFEGRIINIHPALLPDFGGKGMYGMHVHRAVIASGVRQSGITVHLVNAEYDRGDIIFRKEIPVSPDDTPESLARKIHTLEYRYFPPVVEQYIQHYFNRE